MQDYQQNKQKIVNQSKRKHETQRVLASIYQQQQQMKKVEKSCSLPSLKPKFEVIMPEYIDMTETPLEKVNKNLLAKDFSEKNNLIQDPRMKKTLSFSKLGFGRKRVRTICEEEIYEDELTTVEQVREKLRSKGIMMDGAKLTHGLTNTKKYPV